MWDDFIGIFDLNFYSYTVKANIDVKYDVIFRKIYYIAVVFIFTLYIFIKFNRSSMIT